MWEQEERQILTKFLGIVREQIGYKGAAQYVPNPLKSYQYFTQSDMSKTRTQLGFLPKYDIVNGVTEILESLFGEKWETAEHTSSQNLVVVE